MTRGQGVNVTRRRRGVWLPAGAKVEEDASLVASSDPVCALAPPQQGGAPAGARRPRAN